MARLSNSRVPPRACNETEMLWFHHSLQRCFTTSVVMNIIKIMCFSVFQCNTLGPKEYDRRFANDLFKLIFVNENCCNFIHISLKFVHNGRIDNMSALILIMAWRRRGDKPSSEPMMESLTYAYMRHSASLNYSNSKICLDTSSIRIQTSIFLPLSLSIHFHVTEEQVIHMRDVDVDISSDHIIVTIHIYFFPSWWNTRVFLTKREVGTSQNFTRSHSVWRLIRYHCRQVFQAVSCEWIIRILYTLRSWFIVAIFIEIITRQYMWDVITLPCP